MITGRADGRRFDDIYAAYDVANAIREEDLRVEEYNRYVGYINNKLAEIMNDLWFRDPSPARYEWVVLNGVKVASWPLYPAQQPTSRQYNLLADAACVALIDEGRVVTTIEFLPIETVADERDRNISLDDLGSLVKFLRTNPFQLASAPAVPPAFPGRR